MNPNSVQAGAASNPFATRFVSPGCIPYYFSTPQQEEQLLQRGDAANWRGQILGPHGSGKTTLVRHLQKQLEHRFDSVHHLIIRGRNSVQTCPQPATTVTEPEPLKLTLPNSKSLLVIDGVERLSWLQRRLLLANCRRHDSGLIVTTHRPLLSLPVLFKTSLDEERFGKILQHLGTQQYAQQYNALTDRHHSNCREMLFDLYDHHSQQR